MLSEAHYNDVFLYIYFFLLSENNISITKNASIINIVLEVSGRKIDVVCALYGGSKVEIFQNFFKQ